MAIIVKHRRTGNEYILLHIRGREIESPLPSRLLSDLFPPEKSKNSAAITLCDARGNIFSSHLEDFIVVEIDGKKPREILPEPIIPSIDDELNKSNQEDENFPEKDTPISHPSGEREDRLNDDEDWV